MLTNFWKFQNRSVQTFGFVYHEMVKIMVQYGRPSCSSWAESVWSSFDMTIVGKASGENPIETWLGEISKLGMSLCSSWKRIILICVCGWHKIGWKETKSWSDVETTQQRSRFGRSNIFLGSCILGMHSTTMPNKQPDKLSSKDFSKLDYDRRHTIDQGKSVLITEKLFSTEPRNP